MFEQEMSSPPAGLDEAWSSYAPDEPIREQACVFPACRQAAERYDVDLRVTCVPRRAEDGEPPVDIELWPLCGEHYQLRRRPGWSVSRHPSGSIIWRSPDGQHVVRLADRSRQAGRSGRVGQTGQPVRPPAPRSPAPLHSAAPADDRRL